MINTPEFTARLQKILDFYDETASSFAEKIGVQRSSISHILSGRNKPSLDFVMKILHSYPDVELYWLLKGKGSFPNTKKSHQVVTPKIEFPKNPPTQKPNKESEIEKIVIFYKDGTFKSYKP
ncbi:helix-turn-helix transcriptional regulator [Winogradskyella sp.]|jgi:transcriptional regulator with XRE-family HTH domain|uniref:helix-turn-helix domain-containing protein n=1 Tax=Winogradskyella sp. TaxID=1883156 RepID=UPI0025E14CFA|nr:helix-turn-helix transcriptional regulator [Winogradskyella sp.]MCT4629138.1 helix-turn-helix domain-containing protein [Winogradskyella sp.]